MIKLIINAQELAIVTQKVVAGSHNYLTVEADFKGSDWTGLQKWVHFTMGPFSYILPMEDDKITEEQHLDLTEGTWEVYVHGNELTDDEVTERVTTDIKYLFVEAPHDGHPFPPLTPDFEEVLANQVMEAKNIAQAVRDDADDGEFDGATFLPNVSEEGIISWTNDQCKPNPEPRNIKGPKGDTGESGVYIGTTEPTDPVKEVWINPDGNSGKVIMTAEYTGTHQPGTNDYLDLTFSDGTSLRISIYNGVDGDGTGDMKKSIYDPTNQARDVFAAITDAVAPKANSADLATVATSGDYDDLINKPTIPVLPTVDNAMSDSSTNAVQNNVIKAYVDAASGKTFIASISETTFADIKSAVDDGKITVLNIGTEYIPIAKCTDTEAVFVKAMVTDNNVSTITTYTVTDVSNAAVWTSEDKTVLTTGNVDSSLNANSSNPVQNSAITAALAGKQNALTIDSALSSTSSNPVQNKAIKQYVDSKTSNTYMVRTMEFRATVTVPANSQYTGSIDVSPNPFSFASGGGREAYNSSSGKQGYRFRGVAGFYNNWLMPMTIVYLDGNTLRYNVLNTSASPIDCSVKIDLFYTNDVGI